MAKKRPNRFLRILGIRNEFNRSRLDYPLKKFYFRVILYVLISILSVTILLPYAYNLYCKMKYEHMLYDNKRLKFDGKIRDIYIIYIEGLIIAFTIIKFFATITAPLILIIGKYVEIRIAEYIYLGINSIPTAVNAMVFISRFYKWGQANAHFTYFSFNGSYMRINLIGGIVSSILRKLTSIATFGICAPLAIWYKQRYLINRQYVSGIKIIFTGTVLSAYGWLAWRLILSVITIGLYLPVYLYKLNEWTARNVRILN